MFSICSIKRTANSKLQLFGSSSAQQRLTILPRRLLRLLPRRYRCLILEHFPLLLLFTITTIILISVYVYWTTNQFTFPPNPRIIYTAAQMYSVQTLKLSPPAFRDPCAVRNFTSPLLVMVTSAPHHFAQRSAIRETWGRKAAELGIRLFYLIGEVDSYDVQEEIYREHFAHRDLLQAAFADTYFNLTLKSLAMMNWIGRTLERGHCSKVRYALKVDDDMFVNIEAIEKLVKTMQNESDGEKFVGRLHCFDRPIRSLLNKYYLRWTSYPKTVFPNFVTGAAYLFTARSAASIYHIATQESERAIYLEDVYVTGIIPERLNNSIARENHPNFVNWEINVDNRADFDRIWTSHNVAPKEMRRRWKVVNERSQHTCRQFWWC